MGTISVVSPKTLEKGGDDGKFKREIMTRKLPTSNLTAVLQNGNREPQRTSITKLRRLAKKLCKSKRFNRALEVCYLLLTVWKLKFLASFLCQWKNSFKITKCCISHSRYKIHRFLLHSDSGTNVDGNWK